MSILWRRGGKERSNINKLCSLFRKLEEEEKNFFFKGKMRGVPAVAQ